MEFVVKTHRCTVCFLLSYSRLLLQLSTLSDDDVKAVLAEKQALLIQIGSDL